jgi:uncharacterized protein YbjQ (UPF0145 family)
MGNFPAKVMSFPHHAGGVTVSTRSDPPEGYVVMQDIGIVTANSTSFNRNAGEKECMMQVLDLARKECQKLGGNYVLGVHFEIKQFGDSGAWMVYSLTGMACVVKKRAAAAAAAAPTPSAAHSATVETVVPIATATVIDDRRRPAATAATASAPYNPYAKDDHNIDL